MIFIVNVIYRDGNNLLTEIDTVWGDLNSANKRRMDINEDPFTNGYPVGWEAVIIEKELQPLPVECKTDCEKTPN